MPTPELPEHVPEMPEAGGGVPILPGEAEGPLPPPRPIQTPLWLKALNVACITGAVAGGLFVLTLATTSRTCGATRSYRLQCEQRRQEIAAVAQEEAREAPSDRTSTP